MNSIFAQFVSMDDSAEEAERLSGIVAYGLYKIAKHEWVTDLFDREQRVPNEAELAGYSRTWTTAQIEGKREQAETILAKYANSVIEAATPGIEKEALKGSFWKAIGYSIVANVAYTALLILFIFILKFAGVDLFHLIQNMSAPIK